MAKTNRRVAFLAFDSEVWIARQDLSIAASFSVPVEGGRNGGDIRATIGLSRSSKQPADAPVLGKIRPMRASRAAESKSKFRMKLVDAGSFLLCRPFRKPCQIVSLPPKVNSSISLNFAIFMGGCVRRSLRGIVDGRTVCTESLVLNLKNSRLICVFGASQSSKLFSNRRS